MTRRHSPLQMMLEQASDNNNKRHSLSDDAQVMNLRAAWEYYREPKRLEPGRCYRERRGLGIFSDDPVLLFVRLLDPSHPSDVALIEDGISRLMCNKLDCVVARCRDDGGVMFCIVDSDVLDPFLVSQPCE